MSKAILVVDMPSNCKECDFVFNAITDRHPGYLTCMNPESSEYGCDVTDYQKCRAKGCPLKELPNKKKDTSITNYKRYVRGWNDCIDRILEGSDEE